MRSNAALRQALLARRKFSPQRLSQLVTKRKDQLPMSTALATYTIAHESGIDITKYLTPDQVAEVRGLMAQLRGGGNTPQAAQRARPAARRPVHVTIAGFKVEHLPGLSPTHAREAKEMAEKVFPVLYVFENSLRDIIERVLRAAFGDDWWEKGVPRPVRDRATHHRADEKKDPWHGKRGSRELDYILLTDLLTIVRSPRAWPHFSKLFPRQSWLEGVVDDLNVSRRVIAHMNPLASDDIQSIEAGFSKWVRQLRAIEGQLP